jgi:hypothetical protein
MGKNRRCIRCDTLRIFSRRENSKSNPKSAFAAGRGFAALPKGSKAKPTRSEKVEVGLMFDFHDGKKPQMYPL